MELEGLDAMTLLSTIFSSRWLAMVLPSPPSLPHHQPEHLTFKFGIQRQVRANWTYLYALPQKGCWALKPAAQFNLQLPCTQF
jgi:hypothetical protein